MSFWKQFEPATCLPDNCNCELVRDAFIRQPSAFWSSFSYLAVSLATVYLIKHHSTQLRNWAFVCFVMGLSSLFGHMSFTRFSLAIDISSIILVMTFFPVSHFTSKKGLSKLQTFSIFIVFYISLFIGIYHLEKWPKVFLCIVVFTFVLKDSFRFKATEVRLKDLNKSLFILFFSFALFLLDEFHIGCNPESLLQLHSLWHLGTALSMYFYGKWRLNEGF